MPFHTPASGRAAYAQRGPYIVVALTTLLVGSACGGAAGIADGGATGSTTPGIRIISGASVTDTISAIVGEALTVEVTDVAGRPAVARDVLFEATFAQRSGPNSPQYGSVNLGPKGQVGSEWQLVVPSDASGRAAVQVQLGDIAGDGSVHITVPQLGAGYAIDAHYTILAGTAIRVVPVPADSVAYVGGGYRLSGYVADRVGNERPAQPIAYSVASGGATVDGSGNLVATATGRVRIVAQAAGVSGSAWMSVPPRAVVAAQLHDTTTQAPLGVFLLELDGSARAPLAAGIDNARSAGQGFSWSPDGRDLALARGDSIDLIAPASAERALVRLQSPVMLGARFSRDGEWIYFARPDSGLARVRRDGSGMQLIGAPFNGGYRPSPSHDGFSVAYSTAQTPCGVEECIRVLDLASGKDRVYAGGKDWLVRGRNSAWSPTEDLVAYAWDTDAKNNEVGVIRSDGTGQLVLAKDLYGVNWMDFSPDGKWLLVGSVKAPVTLFEVRTGARLPLATLAAYRATAWRP